MQTQTTKKCFNCNTLGHLARDCPEKSRFDDISDSDSKVSQKPLYCNYCKKKGHNITNCRILCAINSTDTCNFCKTEGHIIGTCPLVLERKKQAYEKREAEKREEEEREAEKREEEEREAKEREAAEREAEEREAEKREAKEREAAEREAKEREAAERDKLKDHVIELQAKLVVDLQAIRCEAELQNNRRDVELRDLKDRVLNLEASRREAELKAIIREGEVNLLKLRVKELEAKQLETVLVKKDTSEQKARSSMVYCTDPLCQKRGHLAVVFVKSKMFPELNDVESFTPCTNSSKQVWDQEAKKKIHFERTNKHMVSQGYTYLGTRSREKTEYCEPLNGHYNRTQYYFLFENKESELKIEVIV